jgi:dipeptidase
MEARAAVSTSCDTLVVLGPETRAGRTLFAKNSDRPATECQPLDAVPARRHPAGSIVRCTYLEIPEVPETLAVLGSRPRWIWGFEHGVNARGVAIGNEALHTREAPAEVGLLGMDLVRLGLERGRTADEAKRVITDLLERHGQGGSAQHGGRRFYQNSFIVADPGTAWVLETSGRHWVARRVRGRAAISNLATIGDDWDEASDGIEAHAAAQGWWSPRPGRRFDFRAAFENPEPRFRATGRYDASCRFLSRTGRPGVPEMQRHLRDHYEGGTIHHPGRKDGDPRGWSICMHPGPASGATAAAMVAELDGDGAVVAWCAQTTPCTSIFLPLAVGTELPDALTCGTGDPDPVSAWWLLKELGDGVMVDPVGRTPLVQSTWHAWERRLLAEVAADRRAAGRDVAEQVERMLRAREALLEQMAAGRLAAHGA